MKINTNILLLLSLVLLILSCKGEKPGDPVTTGLRQFLADDFSFKYANDAILDVKGEQGNVVRTFTVNGPDIVLEDQSFRSYKIELKVYHHNNLGFTEFLRDLFPGSDEEDFSRVRIRGKEAKRFETLEADASFIYTAVVTNDKIVIVSMKLSPQSLRSVYYLTLDSMRFTD